MNVPYQRSDMIRRAREFAALADKATPGPWSLELFGDNKAYIPEINYPDGIMPLSNAEFLLLARNEVPSLLLQLADALEEAYNWMYDWHGQNCTDFPRHAQNCPVWDLDLAEGHTNDST